MDYVHIPSSKHDSGVSDLWMAAAGLQPLLTNWHPYSYWLGGGESSFWLLGGDDIDVDSAGDLEAAAAAATAAAAPDTDRLTGFLGGRGDLILTDSL